MKPARWVWVVPLAGTLVVGAAPLVRHVQKTRAESAAAAFLERLHAAQQAFRATHRDAGYASSFDSLAALCPGAAQPRALPVGPRDVAGYDATLRPAVGAISGALDCHGRPLSSDYYAALSPSDGTVGQQAFAITGTGRIFVFFDGIAPVERDMTADGLATPIEALDTFKIP